MTQQRDSNYQLSESYEFVYIISPMLKLAGVSKVFGASGEFGVLRDISFTVKKGELACILGPSGCGKTILLYLIAGFLKSTAGTLSVDSRPIVGPDPNRMMIFQDYVLFPWKTVYENIHFALDRSSFSQAKNMSWSRDTWN